MTDANDETAFHVCFQVLRVHSCALGRLNVREPVGLGTPLPRLALCFCIPMTIRNLLQALSQKAHPERGLEGQQLDLSTVFSSPLHHVSASLNSTEQRHRREHIVIASRLHFCLFWGKLASQKRPELWTILRIVNRSSLAAIQHAADAARVWDTAPTGMPTAPTSRGRPGVPL